MFVYVMLIDDVFVYDDVNCVCVVVGGGGVYDCVM